MTEEKPTKKETVDALRKDINKENIDIYDELEEDILGENEMAENSFEKALRGFTDHLDLSRRFIKIQPLFYTREKIYWMWNDSKKMWEMIDEVDIMNKIDLGLAKYMRTTKPHIRNEIIEALKRTGRLNQPSEIKKTWVQFNTKIVDIETGEVFDSIPDYFATNPIPWDIGDSEETPIMDNIFAEWVGEENVQNLYDIIAYCMLPDYPVHVLFVLLGIGRNGKDTFMKLLRNFIGAENTCATRLSQIHERFETSTLYKKLMMTSGEKNIGFLKDTEIIKALTGESPINIEFKGKDPFPYVNYAKLILAMNDLPLTLDMTDGFFSRWVIVKFPNQFDGTVDVLEKIPKQEYRNLAKKSVRILKRILHERKITGQGTLEERKETYLKESDSLQIFLDEFFEIDPNIYIVLRQFYEEFRGFLEKKSKRVWTLRETSKALRNKGFTVKIKTLGGKTDTYIWELKRKEEINEINEINRASLDSLIEGDE